MDMINVVGGTFCTLIAAVSVGGAYYSERDDVKRVSDRCEKQVLFERCLARIPKGPNSTVYNDWAEVIDECQSSATKNARNITVEQNNAQTCTAPKD